MGGGYYLSPNPNPSAASSLKLPLWFLITPMSGLMVALFLIRSRVSLLLGLGFFARQAGDCWGNRRWGHVDGLRSVGAVQSCEGFCSVLFLDLFSLSRGLRCGVSFLLCSLLELFILVLIIWVLFGILVGCLMVGIVLFLLNLFTMVIFFC